MFDEKPTAASKLRAWFYSLPSDKRKNVKKYGTISAVAIVLLGIYYGTGQDEKNDKVPEATRVITPNTDETVQGDVVSTLQGQIKENNKQIPGMVKDAVQDAISNGQFALKSSPPAVTGASAASNPDHSVADAGKPVNDPNTDNTSNALNSGYPGEASFPTPTNFNSGSASSDQAGQQAPDAAPKVEWVGDIYQDDSVGLESAPATDDSSKKSMIQLPVGFMKARLLVGVNALTGEFGSDNPQTIMFRVQTPAQLPNYIKMNLSGCFVVANVSGNLSAERVITLPVSMNCITKDIANKKYIVEGPIKGFVSDRDGKRDMSARLVSRAGRLLAGAVLAKSVEGFGQFVSAQGATQNVSALGSVNTFKTDDLAKSGAATGIGGGLSEVSKYILKLAEQTAPTLETGAGKEVNLFIQESAELEIKEVRMK
ncbi:conjugal transfer pilus assembly protein TraB [Rahnella inusitata]|nr:conjugal transfer pilus assembly protein TraB [Rahnella inusitata]